MPFSSISPSFRYFEQLAGQPAGARGDHDGVGLGKGLQARGDSGRFARDIVRDNLAAHDH
jgi:predicted ATPase